MNAKQIIVLLSVLLTVAVFYAVWLDHGCTLSGAMTWHGKVCVEDLAH